MASLSDDAKETLELLKVALTEDPNLRDNALTSYTVGLVAQAFESDMTRTIGEELASVVHVKQTGVDTFEINNQGIVFTFTCRITEVNGDPYQEAAS